MTAKLSDTLTVPVLAMFVACGGAADTTPMDSGVPTVADTTAPSVVATSPEDGASGMGADTVVTITFSEPMSDTSVEADLGLIGFDAVTVSWNQDYTELTVTPDSPLEVVEVPIDSDTPGAVYGVVVSESATDLAGNPLEASTTVEFSVVRQRWGRLAPVTELTRVVTPSSLMFEDHDPLVVGDTADDNAMRSTMTFDLSVLPGAPTSVAQALITTEQLELETTGAPFDGLGSLVLDHVAFDALQTEQDVNGAFNSSQLAKRTFGGIASATSHTDIEVDVTDAVGEDLANALTQSQFLLYFDGFTDLDGVQDRAVFSRDDLRLEVTYLMR